MNFRYVWTFFDFLVKYGLPEVREVSRKLPGARGFAVSEYGPVASHGDPIQPQKYYFLEFANLVVMLSGSEHDYVGTRNLLGANKMDCVDTIHLLGRQNYVLWTHKYYF